VTASTGSVNCTRGVADLAREVEDCNAGVADFMTEVA
jgi:hypothetical protein